MELGAFVVEIMGEGAVKSGRYLMLWSAEVVKKRAGEAFYCSYLPRP
jgi:hypothetical protein